MLRKYVYPTLMAVVAGIWLVGPMHLQAQDPSWQQPPTTRAFNAWASQTETAGEPAPSETQGCQQGGSCASEGECGASDDVGCSPDPFCGLILPHDDWVRFDALLWWTKGGNIPSLLTTSPPGTARGQAGVLGKPGTVVLLGNQELNDGFRAGGRVSFGTWLDACDDVGLEFSYLGLGQSTNRFAWTSEGTSILARPFFNVDTGAESAVLLAYPDLLQGTFSCTSTSEFQVAGLLLRHAIARAPGYRVELLAGYRFQQLTERLDMTGTTTLSAMTTQTSDHFHTQNDFNGGELGIATEWRQCQWSVETNLKLALGNTHSRTAISGSTLSRGQTLLPDGGLLALHSNSGVHIADQFSAIPELGMTVGYDLTCRLRAMVGYSFIYWGNVTRPGDQIDLNVSPKQFPGVEYTAASKPAYVQHTSDFWAQGINVGLDYRF